MKNYLISAIIAALVAGAIGFTYFRAPITQALSAAGSTFSNQVTFQDNIIVGGYDFATSSAGTATYTVNAFIRSRVIEHISATALTVTTPTAAESRNIWCILIAD